MENSTRIYDCILLLFQIEMTDVLLQKIEIYKMLPNMQIKYTSTVTCHLLPCDHYTEV